jgi:hypothetical protein
VVPFECHESGRTIVRERVARNLILKMCRSLQGMKRRDVGSAATVARERGAAEPRRQAIRAVR